MYPLTIRREIRDLHQDEWIRIVNAMWVMKNTSSAEGVLLFGEDFRSYDDMILRHAIASLDSRGDQAHFGPIFGPFHRLWLLEFERALRATDSRIEGLPYWDFDRESNSKFPGIFSDDYFGSLTGDAPDYVIKDGKFAYWGVKKEPDMNSSAFRGVMNVYGYMRHPLSLNKSPFNTRRGGTFCGSPFTSFGDVNMWSGCLSVGDNIADWAACVDSYLHGPAHIAISGSWRRKSQTFDAPNCSQWFGYISPPVDFAPKGTFISAFGLGCFDCSHNCSNDVGNDCSCRPRQKFCGPLWTGLRSNNESLNRAASVELVDPEFIQVLGDLGDPVASPNDPIFPFHHANMDRHFQAWLEVEAAGRSNYWHYPSGGLAEGCNLNDIISSLDPPYYNRNAQKAYTVKDVFDLFAGNNTHYVYVDGSSITSVAAFPYTVGAADLKEEIYSIVPSSPVADDSALLLCLVVISALLALLF